jgi:hypothetical protein
MKSKIVQVIELNSQLWHLSNDGAYRTKLHEMNEKNRTKLKQIEEQLKKY